ncbi:MAG: hypothetical protein GYA14_13895 [Ignavibacteria bacterium]|nr:hypothetical protein [Ignavibacteria bacterium]
MKLNFQYILLLLFILCKANFPQYNGSDFNFAISYNYTTTSKLYLQPNSSDPVLRSEYENLDGIYNLSFEFRYKIFESMIIGLGTEFIQKSYTNRNYFIQGDRVEIKEGYNLIPVELTLYYLLPFSTEKFKFFMGGGGGLYFGKQIREFGNVNFNSAELTTGYGINVSVGMDYLVNEFISVRGQMRFRDPELIMKSKYSGSNTIYNGKSYLLSDNTFTTKVNIDGVTFTIGLSLSL